MGKGFTEWTNTKNRSTISWTLSTERAAPNYYYDLTDESAREWQAQVARKYGMYGFVIIITGFKEKGFFINHLMQFFKKGNPISPSVFPGQTIHGQEHGRVQIMRYWQIRITERKADWKEHFEFLLTAFKDKRYIRVENKPLFLIYRPSDIPKCEEMLEYWKKLAVENGLDGIYIAQTLNRFNNPQLKGFDARIEFEPGYTMHLTNGIQCGRAVDGYRQKFTLMDYDKYWSSILERKVDKDSIKTYLGAFIDWDNSARVGGNSPLIFTGASPEKFSFYLTQQIKRSLEINSDFLFINAWNEWGEGTYLEPDKKYGFEYLEAIKKALENNGYCVR